MQLHTDTTTWPTWSVDLPILPDEIGQTVEYNYFVQREHHRDEEPLTNPGKLHIIPMPACDMASEVVSPNQRSEGKNSVWEHFCAGTSIATQTSVTKLEGQLHDVMSRVNNMLRRVRVIDKLETSLKAIEEDILKLRSSLTEHVDTCKTDIASVKRQMTGLRTQPNVPAQNEQALGMSELVHKMEELSGSLSSRMLQLESSMAVLQPTLWAKETAVAAIGEESGHGDLDIDKASPQLPQVCKQPDSGEEKLEAEGLGIFYGAGFV